jgi:hypothetical protein
MNDKSGFAKSEKKKKKKNLENIKEKIFCLFVC